MSPFRLIVGEESDVSHQLSIYRETTFSPTSCSLQIDSWWERKLSPCRLIVGEESDVSLQVDS